MVNRSCVVCRKGAQKKDLLRFVLRLKGEASSKNRSDGEFEVVCDEYYRLPGRGAYCHLDARCLTAQKLETLLVSSLLRAAKQRGENGTVRHRRIDLVISEALELPRRVGRDRVVLTKLLGVLQEGLEQKRIVKPGRVRL